MRHGFVWVLLSPGAEGIDVAKALGPVLDDDFEAFDLRDHVVAGKRTTTCAANWKLVMDAFAEGYHLKSLHRSSLARFFSEAQLVDDCAPHVRQVGARKTLIESDEASWDFRRDTTAFYNLFPNTVLVFHPLWISQCWSAASRRGCACSTTPGTERSPRVANSVWVYLTSRSGSGWPSPTSSTHRPQPTTATSSRSLPSSRAAATTRSPSTESTRQ